MTRYPPLSDLFFALSYKPNDFIICIEIWSVEKYFYYVDKNHYHHYYIGIHSANGACRRKPHHVTFTFKLATLSVKYIFLKFVIFLVKYPKLKFNEISQNRLKLF